MNAASGGRLCLGIGLSHQIVIESMMGMSFDKPVRHLREYLSVLGPLSRGEPVGVRRRGLPRPRRQLDVAGRHAVLDRRRRARARRCSRSPAELADGTLTWCTGPDDAGRRTSIPTITAAAEAAGRPAPRVIAALPVCVTDDVDGARARAAKVFAVYGQLPSYRAMLDRRAPPARPTSPSSGRRPRSTDRIGALADIGVTDFVAVEFGADPDERQRPGAAVDLDAPSDVGGTRSLRIGSRQTEG